MFCSDTVAKVLIMRLLLTIFMPTYLPTLLETLSGPCNVKYALIRHTLAPLSCGLLTWLPLICNMCKTGCSEKRQQSKLPHKANTELYSICCTPPLTVVLRYLSIASTVTIQHKCTSICYTDTLTCLVSTWMRY